MSPVACLWDPTTGPSQVSMTENAARSLKLKLQIVEVRQRDDVADAFRAAHDGQAEAINVFASPFLASLYREIIDRAAEYRLPAIYQWKEHTEAGSLMSYGPSLPAMFEQAATIAVKILKGAKPSDMPVEQPTKFELAINLKTAKALGVAVPSTLLATADDVVD
jgi:putative ABC transport system substrate-binding protein